MVEQQFLLRKYLVRIYITQIVCHTFEWSNVIICKYFASFLTMPTEMLIPLNSSLYVAGKVAEPEKVIVELGTGIGYSSILLFYFSLFHRLLVCFIGLFSLIYEYFFQL